MSTPSTATAALAPHHQYFSHHQTFQPPVSKYQYLTNGSNTNSSSQRPNGTSRLANAQHGGYASSNSADLRKTATTNGPRQSQQTQKPQQAIQAQAASYESPDMPNSKNQERKPNWAEFYKHGLPKEVIVIDDDDDHGNGDGSHESSRPPPPKPARSHNTVTSRAPATNGVARHIDKRRKTGASAAYDPIYHQQPSYSTTQTPYNDHSPSTYTLSTDRTASAHNTTAATSLGSQASNPAYIRPLEDGVVGQKRKRTRKAAAEEAQEARRREQDLIADPLSDYVPPPNPPVKAREVYVPVMSEPFFKSENIDDEDGHYIVSPDADLTERYQIVKLLGQGTFGKVVEAFDRRKGTKCAIKIIRSIQKYRDASRIELRVLSTLASNDKHNRNKCIHLRDCFDFRNHICIVTDLYGQSVFDFLKSNDFVPFPSTHIQGFARQLLTSVAFLHDLKLIHTDLKPENILLVNNSYQTFTYNRRIPSSSEQCRSARHRKVLLHTEIRLIDFGSATFDEEYHSSVVSTRHYRAPEIILNLGWSYPCDIWSIGCILVEFFTGDALFQTHDNLEHLAMMEAVCGAKLDRDIVKAVYKHDRGHSKNAATEYFRAGKLDYPNASTPKPSKKYVKGMKRLDETIPQTTEFNRQFLDLLKKIFVYNPSKRITAKEALRHPWFRESIQDDGTEATKIRIERERARRLGGYH